MVRFTKFALLATIILIAPACCNMCNKTCAPKKECVKKCKPCEPCKPKKACVKKPCKPCRTCKPKKVEVEAEEVVVVKEVM